MAETPWLIRGLSNREIARTNEAHARARQRRAAGRSGVPLSGEDRRRLEVYAAAHGMTPAQAQAQAMANRSLGSMVARDFAFRRAR